ncbi:hypothetical protein Hanom_Chr05g00441881 [Helianthus anomalus]
MNAVCDFLVKLKWCWCTLLLEFKFWTFGLWLFVLFAEIIRCSFRLFNVLFNYRC